MNGSEYRRTHGPSKSDWTYSRDCDMRLAYLTS